MTAGWTGSQQASGLTPHAPISIVGDADFAAQALLEGWPGDGSLANPYLLEQYEIDASSAHGIHVVGTTVAFVVRDNRVFGGGFNDGIVLDTVQDVLVINNTVEQNHVGIEVIAGTNVSIVSNALLDNSQYGAFIRQSSTDVDFMNNTATGSFIGVWVSYSNQGQITGNLVTGTWGQGIRIDSSEDFTLAANTLTLAGVYLDGTSVVHFNTHVIAPDNLINGLPLLFLKGCSNQVVDGAAIGELIVADCTDVTVANLTLADTFVGVELAFVGRADVSATLVSDSYQGIYVVGSWEINLHDNEFLSIQDTGVHLRSALDVTLADNRVLSPSAFASFRFDASDYLTIERNRLEGAYIGAVFYGGTNAVVRANDILGNSIGLNAGNANDLTIVDNNFTSNGLTGLELAQSTLVRVYHNNFVANADHALDDNGATNSWDNGYPSGGNYWDNYTSPDQCSGVLQNVCPDPDHIVDAPQVIDSDSRDNYPLTYLWPKVLDFDPPATETVLLNGQPTLNLGYSVPQPLSLMVRINDTTTGGSNVVYGENTTGAGNFPGTPLALIIPPGDSPVEDFTTGLPWPGTVGTWSYCGYGADEVGNFNTTSTVCADLTLYDDVPPTLSPLLLSPAVVRLGGSVSATTAVDDRLTGGSNIAGANVTLDGGPMTWPLAAQDSAFNGPYEAVVAVLDTSLWSVGVHQLCGVGWDVPGLDSAPSCATLVVLEVDAPDIENVRINGAAAANYPLSSVPALVLTAFVDDSASGGTNISGANYTVGSGNWASSTPMAALDGAFDSPTESVSATLVDPGTVGGWSYCVYGWDDVPNYNTTALACSDLIVFDDLPPGVEGLALTPASVVPGGTVVLTVRFNDTGSGGSPIGGGNVTVDGAPAGALTAADGSFDASIETATTTLATTAYAFGDHIVCATGWDAALPTSNVNATGLCATLTILDNLPPRITALLVSGLAAPRFNLSALPVLVFIATVDDSATGGSVLGGANFTQGTSWPGVPFAAADGVFDETVEDTTATLPPPVRAGTFSYCVHAWDSTLNRNDTAAACITMTIVDDIAPVTQDLNASATDVVQRTSITLQARIVDSATGDTQVRAARFTVVSLDSGTLMTASDGAFSSSDETVTGVLDTSNLTPGNYQVCIAGEDAAGNIASPGACLAITVREAPLQLQDFWWIVILLVAGVLLAILLLIWLRRRRDGDPEVVDSDETDGEAADTASGEKTALGTEVLEKPRREPEPGEDTEGDIH